MANIAFKIGNCEIAWPFWMKVVKLCRGDKEVAGRVFFRAAKADEYYKAQGKPFNPMGWIVNGFKPDEKGKRYALVPCMQEENGSAEVNAWIAENITSRKGVKGMVKVNAALCDFLKKMLVDAGAT